MIYNQTFDGQMAQLINNAKIWDQCLWIQLIRDALSVNMWIPKDASEC